MMHLFGFDLKHKDKDLSFSKTDSAPYLPKCVVVDRVFDWQSDNLLNIPLHKIVIYELHVKGFSKTGPEYSRRYKRNIRCNLPSRIDKIFSESWC